MADQVEHPGRLIAIDGTRGKDVAAAAAALKRALKDQRIECAVSRFDASGLFGELAAAGHRGHNISARTMTLVYAADLAFRLRWEIRPALEAGGVVIATTYLESAVAVGAAFGLDVGWIHELLRFAPRPHFRVRAEEKKIDKAWNPRLDGGYGEYSAAMLGPLLPKGKAKGARNNAVALLQRRKGRQIYRMADSGLADLAKAITGSPRAARSRSASRPYFVRTRPAT